MYRILTAATALALYAPVAAHAEKFMICKSQFMEFIRSTNSAFDAQRKAGASQTEMRALTGLSVNALLAWMPKMMVEAAAMPSESAYCADHATTIATYMLTGQPTDAGDETSSAKSVYQNMVCYAQYRQVIKAAASAFRALDAKAHDGQDELNLIMRSVGSLTNMVQASAEQVRQEQPGKCDQVAAKQFSDLGDVGDQGVTAAGEADRAANDARAAVEKDAQVTDADRARIEAEAKAKIEAERAQIEAEAKAKVRAQIEADLRAKAVADATAKAEADAKADIAAAQQAKDKAAADAKAATEARMEAEAVARNEDAAREAKAADEAAARDKAEQDAQIEAQHEANVRKAKARDDAAKRAADLRLKQLRVNAEGQRAMQLKYECSNLTWARKRRQQEKEHPLSNFHAYSDDMIQGFVVACDELKHRGIQAFSLEGHTFNLD